MVCRVIINGRKFNPLKQDLGSAIGMGFEHAADIATERVELTGPWRCLSGEKSLLFEPPTDGSRIECQLYGNLRGSKPFVLFEMLDLLKSA